MNKTTIIAVLVVSVLLIAGCGKVSTTDSSTAGASDTGEGKTKIANPASVNCEDNGGKLQIVSDDAGGQIGMCTLSDGTVCEEWAFYRGECGKENSTAGCGECPMQSPPSPGMCKDGVLVSGGTDRCGCNLPPKCDTSGGKGTRPEACTEEAKVCPDGSAVGRTGPNCEFAECPATE